MEMMNNYNNSKGRINDIDPNHLGYVGIWPTNNEDVKVVPMGAPGVPLTDIYDEMMHSNKNKRSHKPAPIGDHSYPIPVPVPVITPRTHELTRNVVNNLQKEDDQNMNSASLRPKRRSLDQFKSKNQSSQLETSSRRMNSKLGFISNELNKIQKSVGNIVSNKRLSNNISSSTSHNTKIKKSVNSNNNSNVINTQKRNNSVSIPQRNSSSIDASMKHRVPEDYGTRLRNEQSNSFYSNNNLEYPTVPYPFSISEDGCLHNNFNESSNFYLNNRNEYDLKRGISKEMQREIPREMQREIPREMQREIPREMQREIPREMQREIPREMQREIPREMQREMQREIPRERQGEIPKESFSQGISNRKVSQNVINPNNYKNFAFGRSNVPYNTNINQPKDHLNYIDNYYNKDEFCPMQNYGRSSSLGRPTLTNMSLNPFDDCLPNNSPNQLHPTSLNCYSVPKKYKNSIKDFNQDNYVDSTSCFNPSKTLVYCSGEYDTLEADKHIKQNYSSADEVFKPMVYETIVYPPGYFEYKKQLEELKKKFLLEKNSSDFYNMKQNGEFNCSNLNQGCIWNNNDKHINKRSHPVFVKTTGTINHLNRVRPNQACYC